MFIKPTFLRTQMTHQHKKAFNLWSTSMVVYDFDQEDYELYYVGNHPGTKAGMLWTVKVMYSIMVSR